MPGVAIGVLLDLSGCMSRPKFNVARVRAAMPHPTCKKLDIWHRGPSNASER